MNVLKIFRRRSQSAPMKPSRDVLGPQAPVRNLLILIDCEKEEIESTLMAFKGYFGDENIIKATSDGTVFYVGIQEKHLNSFIKKMVEEEFRCKTFTLGFVTEPEQKIDRFKSLAETNNITELILRRFDPHSLDFYFNDDIEAPERRFSVDELNSSARRPSVLGLFEDDPGSEKSKSTGDLRAPPSKSPEPIAPHSAEGLNAKALKKRRSVPHLLSE